MSTQASAHPEQSTDSTQPPAKRRFDACSPASMLSFLYDRNEKFDREELEFLGSACDTASLMSDQLADALYAIGCVVASDYQPGSVRAGNFENGDTVSQLLFVIANQVKVIGTINHIGTEAAFSLQCKGNGDE